ncbi:MAG TPA: hypothetical protein VNG71_20005 [Pyrinomonadaceae bacterium]|nr:hypothetical protein [Pyrinomonadaceae bacterium]
MPSVFSPIVVLLVLFVPALAQQTNPQKVTSAYAILTTVVDTKSSTVGQQLTFRIVADLVVKGLVVIPRDSMVYARISDVQAKRKDQPQSALAIVVEKAKRPDGIEVPLQAIIAAVAAPTENSLSSDPTYGMLHSNEPRMSGAGAGTTSRTGDLTASSKASATAAVATAGIKGPMEEGFLLNESSAGAIGYEGLTLSWGLAAPPPFTIFVSKNKSIKLNVGTQVLLRMAPPRLPQ